MKLSIEDKKIIAAKASFIEERIAGIVISAGVDKNGENDNAKNDNAASEIIKRWAKLTSDGLDNKGFERRLKLAGKNPGEMSALTGPIAWNDEKPLPEWISTLEDFFKMLPATYAELLEALPAQTLSSEYDTPFQHAWVPWLLLCHKIFKDAAAKVGDLLSKKAEISWLRYILNLMNKEFALCLNSAFDLLRFNDFNFFKMPSAASFPHGSKTRYDNFSRAMLEGGWLDFFKKYPVAARLISVLCRQQALYFADTLKNFEKDADKIGEIINGGINPGLIINLEAGLSDFHNGGKSVIRFEFENGPAVYYKPRPGGVDTLWTAVLNWLAQKMPGVEFKTPAHAEGSGCSWVKNISDSGLDQIEDAAGFYYKAGAILALVYTLGGTDFHQENIIASGNCPVLIDLETILNPLVKPFNYTQMSAEDKNDYLGLEGDSVLRTCMLPLWMPVSKEVSRDYGGLTPDDNASYLKREWLDINTDRMRREYIDRKNNPSPNVARYNGLILSVNDYKDDVIKGFEDAYKLIMNNRDEFLGDNGPLKKAGGIRMRYLTRQSQVYADMIDRLRSPGLMRDGAAFSIEIEGLAKPFLNNAAEDRVEAVWKVFEAERRSLVSLNIPLFEFSAGGLSVFDADGTILGDYFLETAIEQAEKRALKLGAADMEFQSNMIDASLSCRFSDEKNKNTPLKIKNNEDAFKLPPVSENEYIKTAALIAAKIAERVIYTRGKPQWLTLKTDPLKHINFIGPIDFTLYEGISGVGLFLGAYEKLSGDKTHHGLAINCFTGIKEMLNDKAAAAMAAKSSPGYCGGMPGILWALYNTGNYLNDEELISSANKGLALLGHESPENDEALDIIGGAAGGALTLAAFYGALGGERLLEFIKSCAERLINKRFQYDKWKLWPSNHAFKPLTGFAHGAAGYALALAKAYEFTRVDIFKEAALEAVDYEASSYISLNNNWPDFRHNRDLKPGETAFMAGWCSGAPGIGLARIKMPPEFHNRQVKDDIENALNFTLEFAQSGQFRDHLCCGNAGHIDFLIEAAIELNRPQLMEEAKKRFSFVINRSGLNGSYTLPVDESKSIFTPGLFTGLAGIGLTALRLIDPKLIRSVLAPGANGLNI